MPGSVVSSLCGCESENEDPVLQYEPLAAQAPHRHTRDDRTDVIDVLTDNVSSTLARIGSVLVIRGNADKLTYDPYRQCHTVRLTLSSLAHHDGVNDPDINNSLFNCKLAYVERFDVDLSGIESGHKIEFNSFIEKYRSTIREVRVGAGPVFLDLGIVAAGYGRIFDSLHLVSHLERLTLILESAMSYPVGLWTQFFDNDLPYLPNLLHLRLQAASFGPGDITFSGPALQTLELEETVSHTGVISLVSLARLSRLSISSDRNVALSESNPQLQFIELHRVPWLSGDMDSVSVANIESCPAELVAHVLNRTSSRDNNTLRHLGLRFIHAPYLYINANHLDVVFLSNATIGNINVSRPHKMQALYLHDVRMETNSSSIRVRHLVLSGFDHTICSYLSKAGIQAKQLQSLAIDLACEGCPSAGILDFLRKAKDTLTLFACFNPRLQRPKMPYLKYMAAPTVSSSQLPGMLLEKQLAVFACPTLEWEAVGANQDILAVSKSQTSCDEVSQFWYANLGFETPLVHGASNSWSFLLSQSVRKILRDDDAFVERIAPNRVLESTKFLH